MDFKTEISLQIKLIVTNHFLGSNDFNGILLSRLGKLARVKAKEIKRILSTLLENKEVELSFAVASVNPYIKRLSSLPLEKQLSLLKVERIDTICVYPNPQSTLAAMGTRYDNRPYTKRLALVEAQVTPIFFELIVLDRYFRDPRFHCWFGDSNGNITIGDDAYLSDAIPEKDKVSFKFGIGYDDKRTRVVAVFLYELAHLSPEHQQSFRSFEVSSPCVMNSDFERAMIWGLWGEYESVYHAFIQEQIEINRLSVLIGKERLFKRTFADHDRPLGFGPMLRPTKKEYEEFLHLLDKMLSENINRDFFRNDIPMEEEVVRKDGRIQVTPSATITLLEQWFKKRYRTSDGEDVSAKIVASLRAVRKARQPNAHAIVPNQYDLRLPRLQDKIIGETKEGLTLIRWALTSHPYAKSYKAPDWLDGDKIVFF